MSGYDPASLPGRGIKPLVSLLAHPRLALAIFIAVLIASIPLVFIKGKTYYAATATVQVMPRYMKNLRDDGELSFPSNTQYREFRQQQAKSVLRYEIVRDALRSLGEEAGLWRLPGESERLAVDRLRRLIAVRPIPDTYLIEVSLQTEKKEGLANLVNAVVNVYLERMQEERVYGSDVRVRNLEERQAELLKSINDKTDRRTELALQLGTSAFSGVEENPYDRVLADLRVALAKARQARFDAEAKLDAFVKRGETDIETRSIQEAVLIDPGLANLKSNLFKRRGELLSKLTGLTGDHPAYQELDEEMQRIDTELADQTEKLSQQVRDSVLARYQVSVDQARQVESELEREFDTQQQQGARFANLYNRAMTLTHDLGQERTELDAIRSRLNDFAAEENSFGFVRLVSPALAPELPFGPGKKKIALMALFAALFAGLAAPIGRDLLDRRLHTVNEAERVLGVPALGWMVEQADTPTRMFGEDLLRRLAGGLIREHGTQGTRVFAFSSAKPGAGSSELVLALGRTLDGLGHRTLVVEANAFKPNAALRPVDGVPLSGLAQCLQQECEPFDGIAPATADLPDRLWVGDTGDRRHLERVDRMGELAEAWAERYRIVLVDIPPLLLSADAEILARSLQHLLLVVEAGAQTAGELRRVGRLLEKLEPAAVGLLVNRVRPFKGGGYLQEQLLEYLTGRKTADYFTMPSWALLVRARLAALGKRRPRLPSHST
jgi:uncharacterized protein involved in exopolysaccharide biosynthesis/Mrp family chromosome partitioning ATPase